MGCAAVGVVPVEVIAGVFLRRLDFIDVSAGDGRDLLSYPFRVAGDREIHDEGVAGRLFISSIRSISRLTIGRFICSLALYCFRSIIRGFI